MKGPGAAERGEFGFAQQNTGGESNPADFSVIRIYDSPGPEGFSRVLHCLRSAKGRLKAALCPLSVHPDGKLMQKIHRLTDN
jgi:hypothetical protein